jgi:hypothetical protein
LPNLPAPQPPRAERAARMHIVRQDDGGQTGCFP